MSLMKEKNYKKYEGKELKAYNPKFELAAYFPSDELIEAVELARLLQRPLLLRGDPGSGKTRLAEALAFEIHGKDYQQYYFPWYIKSSTKARDGLYTFDHLRRLRDVNAGEEKIEKTEYRDFGPLGNAFRKSTAGKPAVVLIDEIDKADLDFPNDLLLELDEKRFFVPETGEPPIEAGYPPIIIITSNDEKELPGAFLRRCVFHYIKFPDEDKLLDIVRAKVKHELDDILPETVLTQVVKRFRELHDDMKKDPNTEFLPSTSALLDWVTAITYYTMKGELKHEGDGRLVRAKDESLLMEKETDIPYYGVLLKTFDDYRSRMGEKSST